jgi:hypothetical protein
MTGTLPPLSDARRLKQRFRREELFRLALLRNGEDDRGRAHAISRLYRLYRWQLRAEGSVRKIRAEKGEPPLSTRERAEIVDWRLQDLIKGLEERIDRSEDPVRERKRLFQPQGHRGPKAKNEDRDFEIAVSVCRYILRGKSLEEAIAQNADLEGISETRVKKIYFAQLAKWTEAGLRAEVEFIESAAAEKLAAESKTSRSQAP